MESFKCVSVQKALQYKSNKHQQTGVWWLHISITGTMRCWKSGLTDARYDVWCMSTALSHRTIKTALWEEQMNLLSSGNQNCLIVYINTMGLIVFIME